MYENCSAISEVMVYFIFVCGDGQIENEYGSYRSVDCGHDYMAHLRDVAQDHLRDDVVLFTTDGNALSMLECGTANDTYATVDFGPTAGLSLSLFASIGTLVIAVIINITNDICRTNSRMQPICHIDRCLQF